MLLGRPPLDWEPEGVVCSARQGQVLNQTSCWWMHRTKHIVPNALTAEPHPNAVVMQRCQVFPVEFVVRGFITGQSADSLKQRCMVLSPSVHKTAAELPQSCVQTSQ